MKIKLSSIALVSLFLLESQSMVGQRPAEVEMFSPQGIVKHIRQVQVRFSEAITPLGDPRSVVTPFDMDCPEKGTARWADGRNWVFDFDRDLAAGIRCEFRLKEGLKTLAGSPITGKRVFSFSTGGPSILRSNPYQGADYLDEEQIFVLELDAEATEASVLSHVYFTVQGLEERVGVRIVSGDERQQILKSQYRYRRKDVPLPPILMIQAKQRFPNHSKISLVWGKAVATRTGVTNESDQILPFVTRPQFIATFHCQRENPQKDCVPVSAMHVSFSASVAWSDAMKTVLKGPNGQLWHAQGEEYENEAEKYAESVVFKGPFPEKTEFQIEIPPELKDDAGRKLSNADRFPLKVRTDEYPPLAKFAASFGIIELNAEPMLPVTLRNVEPAIAGRMMEVAEGESTIRHADVIRKDDYLTEEMRGMIYRVPSDRSTQMLYWIQKSESRSWEDRDKSIFTSEAAGKAKPFSVPKLHGAQAFEVLGIPLPSPGFYVVEIQSELLGAALLGKPRPMFVSTTALVTNLSVHLKWGIESSLVWVTTLDKAKPVNNSSVQIRNCKGEVLWEGQTDPNGIARVDKLPDQNEIVRCSNDPLDTGLFVTARLGEDLAFVHSSWDEGIEPWRFQLPMEYDDRLIAAHTVFDRTLLRAGETVHMKHFLRRHVSAGFAPFPEEKRPKTIIIQHVGSNQKYELAVQWDSSGIAESTWAIPKEAKLGHYMVILPIQSGKYRWGGQSVSGEFRVEEYRVPLMKAVNRSPEGPLVSPSQVNVDMMVGFLAGGGAGDLPVKFRHHVQPRFIPPVEGFEDFVFANGRVKEGVVRGEVEEETEGEESAEKKPFELKSTELTLDKSGSIRTTITGLPKSEKPLEILTELEFRDPNGEIQTVSSRIPLWPAQWLVGIKPDSWVSSKDLLRFQVAVTGLNGKPVAEAPVKVDLLERKTYSHRKRLVGGFYAYENYYEVKEIQAICNGKTNPKGLLFCQAKSPISGNVILQASTTDPSNRESTANREVWVAGKDQWWFAATNDDRIDVLPEKKRYEPGETARFQVRMPFKEATALVSVEREGVVEAFVTRVSGSEPVIEVPVKGSFAPNVFVSVLLVRERVSGVQPTATIDLGRPSYKLGIAQINVGWKAHELNVKVTTDRPVYKIREKARVAIAVKTPDGKAPPRGSEVAVAAVDEGLLELMPNGSWQLLNSMMGRRGYGVRTSTAQTHVIGKRHFGLKALPTGGGGGKQSTRELFDTLLLWKGRVPLDENGEASVEIPLNDSLTSFRIVAVATGGLERFGTGFTSIRSTQDLMIFSGIAPVVRENDRFRSEFTLRNATEQKMEVQVSGQVKGLREALKPANVQLQPGESRIIGWNLVAPVGADSLRYEIDARGSEGSSDRLAVVQKVVPAVPVRIFQATLLQIEKEVHVEVDRPKDALPGRGGLRVSLRPTLVDGMDGITEYMKDYPYSCLEQEVSKAIALREEQRWGRLMERMPSYLDGDGLAKYFPSMLQGSDVLTSYILSIAHEAGWKIPSGVEQRMANGLRGFVEGRIVRWSSLPTTDLSIRKIAAVEALSRLGPIDPNLLSSITVEPNLWPTSAVIDWFNILGRSSNLRDREQKLGQAEQILRSRLNFQGTTMGFSTDTTDCWWWLMVSNDSNAVRLVLSLLDFPRWKEDMPRLVRGALGRQHRGHWDTTVANAFGVLAMEKFSNAFEKTPVSGQSAVRLLSLTQAVDWSASPKGQTLSFGWPPQQSQLTLSPASAGKPWATIQSLAAIPLKEPFSTGYKITKTLTPVEQKTKGVWSKGDLIRVHLQLEGQSDMTWVVVNDPIPAGAAILGTGLGRDSMLATRGEARKGWIWPAFEERSSEAFRAYYHYVPKGKWTVEYTVRLNSEGIFNLPPTRVEALYSPEMFGEYPNAAIQVVSEQR